MGENDYIWDGNIYSAIQIRLIMDIKKRVHAIADDIKDGAVKEGAEAKKWMDKSKEDRDSGKWLKKGKAMEAGKQYEEAVDAYLKFLEIKLNIIQSRPNYNILSYLNLVPYYLKIAECYSKITHIKREEQIRDLQKTGEYYVKAAWMYQQLKRYNEAHKTYETATKYYEGAKELDKCAECYKEIGHMYEANDNFIPASDAHEKASEYYESEFMYDEAITSLLKSSDLDMKLDNPSKVGEKYWKIAELYKKSNKHDEAIAYYAKSMEISQKKEHYSELAHNFWGIAKDHENSGEYEDAMHCYREYVNLNECENNKEVVEGYKGIARCHSGMGDLKKAIEFYKRAIKMAISLKNFLDIAHIHRSMAVCYMAMEDYENAADSYFSYAKYGIMDEENRELTSVEGYDKAIKLYSDIAEKELKEGNYRALIDIYKKIGGAYSGLGSHKNAGEFFLKAGEVGFKIDKDNALKIYGNAAEEFKRIGDFYATARSLAKAEEYEEAAIVFSKYGKTESERGNFFNAGNGYRNSGDCYKKCEDAKNSRESYNKGAKEYLKHIQKFEKSTMIEDEKANPGNAYRHTGECFRNMGRLPEAKKYYEHAVSYYEENNMERGGILSKALLSKINAKLVMPSGDYPKVSSLLEESIRLLEESRDKEYWSNEFNKFLEENIKDGRDILYEISEKPEILLELDRHSYTFVDTTVVVNIHLENKGRHPVSNVSFLLHIPDDLIVDISPKGIAEIAPGESVRDSVELLPKEVRRYRLKPLEVVYKDKEGKDYVKASNQITIDVVEKPSMEYQHYKNAVSKYLEYAEIQTNNKNFYHAGEGYRGAAECHGRFGETDRMKEFYNKAIESYTQYVEVMGEEEKLNLVELHRISSSQRIIAESYERVNDFLKAEEFFTLALDSYQESAGKIENYEERAGVESQIKAINAFLLKVKGKIAVDHGDYSKALDLLTESRGLFEECLKERTWAKDYEESMDKGMKEIDLITKQIKVKPSLELTLEYPRKLSVNESFTIKINITNKWNDSLHNIGFLSRAPEEFKVDEIPEKISDLKPDESKIIEVKLIPERGGSFKFKPFYVTYRDNQGNNFMKSCDEISLIVE